MAAGRQLGIHRDLFLAILCLHWLWSCLLVRHQVQAAILQELRLRGSVHQLVHAQHTTAAAA